MGKVTGFLEIEREDRDYQPVAERVKHYREFVLPLPEDEVRQQAARCMDCGVPYCHGTHRITGAPTGCPVNNQIPDWNDLVYRGNWDEAARNLHSTNNFPEVTGRDLPGAVRGVLHAQHRRQSRSASKPSNARSPTAPSRRPQAGKGAAQDRQESRRGRLRPRRHGLRAATRARRPRRACL